MENVISSFDTIFYEVIRERVALNPFTDIGHKLCIVLIQYNTFKYLPRLFREYPICV